jgi:hypothetical protein
MESHLVIYLHLQSFNNFSVKRDKMRVMAINGSPKKEWNTGISINEVPRRKRREEVFPVDCEKAFDLGVRLVEEQQKIGQVIY